MTARSLLLTVLLLIGWLIQPVDAQQAIAATGEPPAASATTVSTTVSTSPGSTSPVSTATVPTPPVEIDPTKLPINVARVQAKLRTAVDREARYGGSRLRFTVDVFAQAPPIQLFVADDNPRYGRVPWGGPTHQEMLDVVTPREFRSPVMDFSNLMHWIQSRTKNKD